MNANEFLDRFAEYPFSRLHELRASPLLDQFPVDPSLYRAIVEEVFADCNPEFELRQRLVQILREFLIRDGRSFEALLHVVERAFCQPEYSSNGVNSLAGLWGFLNRNQPAPISDERLLAKFEKWTQNDDLRHNALQCRALIIRRRPDLAPKDT